MGWSEVACGGVGLSLMYEEFKILQWGGVGWDPICGDFRILLVISKNTVDFWSLNFEFKSSLKCRLWEGF